jgi:hypothetical protein
MKTQSIMKRTSSPARQNRVNAAETSLGIGKRLSGDPLVRGGPV